MSVDSFDILRAPLRNSDEQRRKLVALSLWDALRTDMLQLLFQDWCLDIM